jgi:hypothetical protein
MATSEDSGPQVRLGVSPLSWTNDVLAELGGGVPLDGYRRLKPLNGQRFYDEARKTNEARLTKI